MDFFINRFYFKTIHEYGFLKMNIILIEPFHNDKIIFINDFSIIFIYNILENKLLCRTTTNILNIYNFKIQIFKNNRFILFSTDEYNNNDNDLRLYQFTENKEENEYSCIQINRINLKANNIIFKDNKMICIKKGFIIIYNIFSDSYFQLQTKIIIPQRISNDSYHKGFLMGNKKLKIIEYGNYSVELWTFTKYKLYYKYKIDFLNNLNYNLVITTLNNNKDTILIFNNSFIYLFSYKSRYSLKKIYFSFFNFWFIKKIEIDGIYITKNDEIYLYDNYNIFILDIHYNTINRINRLDNENQKSLIIIENKKKIFIVNCSDKIKFFKYSIYNTINMDLKIFFLLYFYFLFFYFIFIQTIDIEIIIICLIQNFCQFYYYKLLGILNYIESKMIKKNYLWLKAFILFYFGLFLYKNK